MSQASYPNDDAATDKDQRPAYKREAALRDAYETSESISEAAERFDASYHTVRNWLIEHGIHTPERRESYSTAARIMERVRLEEAQESNGGESA
jgi:transposase-like protein